MNERDLQLAFYQSTYQRYELTAPNIYLDWQFKEMDILAVRKSGYLDEIEIKLTASDFKADFKKTVKVKRGIITSNFIEYPNYVDKRKHEAIPEGILHCNYFSFLIPEELIDKCGIPNYAGLYTYRSIKKGVGRVTEVIKAPLLHRRKISTELKYMVGRKMAYRYWSII